jgi:hypothetical protein
MRARRLAVPLLAALVFLPFSAFAQTALTGQVRDPAGRPLSGVRVWVLAEGQWDGDEQPDAVTGDDGGFTVTGIPPRTGVVLALCDSGASMDPIALQEIPWEPVDLVLQPTGRVTGRIVGPDGAPVAGASASLVREPRAWGAACSLALPLPCDPQDSGRTDAEGRFGLAGLKPGVYALQVQASGFTDREVRGVRLHSGEAVDDLEVQLEALPGALPGTGAGTDDSGAPSVEREREPRGRRAISSEPESDRTPGAEVRGQVTGPDGEPVPRARLRAAGPGGVTHEALSRGDGSFLLRLEDGTWSMDAQADGYIPVSLHPFEVAGGAAPVDASLQRALVLRGQFPGLDPGEVPAVRVRRGATVHEGEADPDGGYFVTGLAPGPWIVTAELHADGTWNGSRSAVGQVILQPGEAETILDLDFSLGAASLTVHAPAGAESLIASLVRPDGSVLFTSGLTESSTVVFDRLRLGTYHLVWSLGERGATRGEQDVTLNTDREVTLAPPR